MRYCLRRAPFGDPARLAVIWRTRVETKTDQNPDSVPNFQDLQAQNTSFEHIAALRSQPMIFDDGEEPERLSGARVSANFLTVLGVRPKRDATSLQKKDQPTAQPVVIISYALWQGRYGRRKETNWPEYRSDGKLAYDYRSFAPGIYYPASDLSLYIPIGAATRRNKPRSGLLTADRKIEADSFPSAGSC